MKALITIIILSMSIVSCGTLEIKTDGLEDVVENIFDSAEESDDSTSSNSSDRTDSSEQTTDEVDDTIYIDYKSDDLKSDDRFFMGTFQVNETFSYCSDVITIPYTIRVYSHNNDSYIDFEDDQKNLVWIAELFEDETFDFNIINVNSFGDPKINLGCVCTYDVAYYGYVNDQIDCGCTGSGISCSLMWEKMTD